MDKFSTTFVDLWKSFMDSVADAKAAIEDLNKQVEDKTDEISKLKLENDNLKKQLKEDQPKIQNDGLSHVALVKEVCVNLCTSLIRLAEEKQKALEYHNLLMELKKNNNGEEEPLVPLEKLSVTYNDMYFKIINEMKT